MRKLKKSLGKKYPLDKMLLFGSRARDDWSYTSDVDLIVVSPGFSGKKFQDRAADVLALWDERIDLEALCYTPDEFARMSGRIGIVSQAVKEGIAV